MRILIPLRLGLSLVAAGLSALAQSIATTATIDIDATRTTPLHANFSGFNDEVVFPAEYFDYRLNNLAAQLSPGWVRYPSGSFSAAFNWQTGLMVPSWVAQFQGTNIGALLTEAIPWVNGKGGGSFVDAAYRANFIGAKLIVSVNAYTDTPQSSGQMAAFAKANHIPVAVWELANEPYFYKGFFQTGADYAAKMKPYRDAIKAADPGAMVAIYFIDAGVTTPIQFIAGADPAAVNTAANPKTVSVQISSSANPVTVPAYSVVRVDLDSPAVASVVSSASYAVGPVAPQEIVALFGPGVASQAALASLPLPTVLGGISVQITDSTGNTQLAPLFAVGSGQANLLVPAGMAAGRATITVLHGATVALTGVMNSASFAPGLYSVNQDGAGVVAANAYLVTASNQRVNQTVFTCHPPAVRSCLAAPLSLGGMSDTLYIEIYGTGMRGATSVQCFAGGQSVPVLYAGAVAGYAGLDQVNISIPKSLGRAGNVRVYVVADGVASNVGVLNVQ